jgi:hypothetical protein
LHQHLSQDFHRLVRFHVKPNAWRTWDLNEAPVRTSLWLMPEVFQRVSAHKACSG